MSRRWLVPLALLGALSMVLASCADGDGDEIASTTTEGADVDETTTTTGAEETTTTEAELEPTETSASPAEGDAAPASSPSVEEIEAMSDFCTVWTTGEGLDVQDVDLLTMAPAQVEERAQVVNALLVQGVATAPDEIEADFTAMVEAQQQLYALMAEYGYDVNALFQAASDDAGIEEQLEALFGEDFEVQADNVENWVAANC